MYHRVRIVCTLLGFRIVRTRCQHLSLFELPWVCSAPSPDRFALRPLCLVVLPSSWCLHVRIRMAKGERKELCLVSAPYHGSSVYLQTWLPRIDWRHWRGIPAGSLRGANNTTASPSCNTVTCEKDRNRISAKNQEVCIRPALRLPAKSEVKREC